MPLFLTLALSPFLLIVVIIVIVVIVVVVVVRVRRFTEEDKPMRCFCFFVGASSLDVFFPPLVELAPADAFAFLDFKAAACGADEATSDGVIETVRERCCAMIDGSGLRCDPKAPKRRGLKA